MALEPITRQEKIIAGQDLTPITRMEMFLKNFGGGGGGGAFRSSHCGLSRFVQSQFVKSIMAPPAPAGPATISMLFFFEVDFDCFLFVESVSIF